MSLGPVIQQFKRRISTYQGVVGIATPPELVLLHRFHLSSPSLVSLLPYQIPGRFEVGGSDLEDKIVLVIDVSPEFEDLLPEFVRLDDAEALAVLHLIVSILQARGLEDDQQ